MNTEDEKCPSIIQIVSEFLKENEYDGLFHEDFECGCFLGNLFPCDYTSPNCQAGVKVRFEFDGEIVDGIGYGQIPSKEKKYE